MQLNALIYIMDIELRIILVRNPLEPFMLPAAAYNLCWRMKGSSFLFF